jgi:hypothetical protein
LAAFDQTNRNAVNVRRITMPPLESGVPPSK